MDLSKTVTEFEVLMPSDAAGFLSPNMTDWSLEQRETYGRAFALAQQAAGNPLRLESIEVQPCDHSSGNYNYRIIAKVALIPDL